MPVDYFGRTKLGSPPLQSSWSHGRSLRHPLSKLLVALCGDFQMFRACFRELFVF